MADQVISNMQVRVANPGVSNSDNQNALVLGGKAGEMLVAELHAKYYTNSVRGNMYIGSTAAAGVAIPIFSSTTQQFGIMNPLGSNMVLVPVRVNIGWVSGPAAPGNVVLGYLTGVGASIATGAPISAATTGTPVPSNLVGKASAMKLLTAGITTTAPSLLMSLGINNLTTTAATTGATAFEQKYDFDGHITVPPGNAIYVAANVAAYETAIISVVWEEVSASQLFSS